MNLSSRYLLPLLIVFILLSIFIAISDNIFPSLQLDRNVLFIANCLFFLVSAGTFFIQKKGLKNANPHVFVRSVMGSMMLKMFICVAAVVIYAIIAGDQISKASVFLSLFFYLLYLTAEVISLLKLNKQHHA